MSGQGLLKAFPRRRTAALQIDFTLTGVSLQRWQMQCIKMTLVKSWGGPLTKSCFGAQGLASKSFSRSRCLQAFEDQETTEFMPISPCNMALQTSECPGGGVKEDGAQEISPSILEQNTRDPLTDLPSSHPLSPLKTVGFLGF